MRMKHSLAAFRLALRVGLAVIAAASAKAAVSSNVPPSPVVIQAVQRPGTTFMDIDYRVNDPDDATVQTAALAFVNGGTSLSNVIKISTLVEGTAANVGSNTPANTTKRLTWNVAADWNTNFGNVQVEILAKDGRGLLPSHWITLPSNGPNPEITVNDRPIYDVDLLPIWYWLIATGDPAIQLVNGQVLGVGGNYGGSPLAEGGATTWFGRRVLWERFDLHSLSGSERARVKPERYGLNLVNAYSVARPFLRSQDLIYGWGANNAAQLLIEPVADIAAVAVGESFTLVLAGGKVDGWGDITYQQALIPNGLTNVVAIAAGSYHSLALTSEGRVVGWGENSSGQIAVPHNLSNVVAIAAGSVHSLALTADGHVVGWGYNVGSTSPGRAIWSSLSKPAWTWPIPSVLRWEPTP